MNNGEPTQTEIVLLGEILQARTMLTCFVLAFAKRPDGAWLPEAMDAELDRASKIVMPSLEQDIYRQAAVTELRATLRRILMSADT